MQNSGESAILFADVSGSTQLYDTLGDVRARVIVARCVDIMSEITKHNGGALVKTIGDEVMTTFSTSDLAAAAATAMQKAITGQFVVEGRPLAIRVGFHYGPTLVEEADIFGDAVNLASRMANQAKAGQILTTGPSVARLSAAWQASTRQIDRTDIRGKRDQIDVFELVWQAEEATLIRLRPWANVQRSNSGRLMLSAAGQCLELGDSRPTVTIGRAEQNDLVIKSDVVSRLHARLEYRNGRFVLTDQSANGTYIVPDHAHNAFVHRDSLVLVDSGLLGLGESPSSGSLVTIRYEPVPYSA